MKRSFSILVVSLLVLLLTPTAGQSQISTSSPLLTGCVGACGSSFSGSFVAPTERVYRFSATSSLCPNHDAFAAIIVNGSVEWSGQVVNGTNVKFKAEAGHTVTVLAGIAPNGKPIQCVWLGEVNFAVH